MMRLVYPLVAPGLMLEVVLWLLGQHSGRDHEKDHLHGFGFGILVNKRALCSAEGVDCCLFHSTMSP